MAKTKTHTPKHVPENKPLNASRYTGFYLTLLILSTVGTSLGVGGLLNIPESIRNFEISPLYSILNLFTVLVILPVAVWALVLLWLKRPLGIWLKLGTYAASILCAVGLLILVSTGHLIRDLANQAFDKIPADQKIDPLLIERVVSITLYIGLGLAIIASVVFGLLWWFAWKKQKEADSE